MIKYEILLGLNDEDTHKQELTDEQAIHLVSKLFEYATLSKVQGIYKGELENTLKIEFIGEVRDRVQLVKKVERLKSAFNQECILLTETILNDVKFF